MNVSGPGSQTVTGSPTNLLGVQVEMLKNANEIPREVVEELVNNVNAAYDGVGRNIDRLA
ncbi:MAG: hypothetical protein QME81_03295 [bacterium]|nr:hypothetical protein [bacterium]